MEDQKIVMTARTYQELLESRTMLAMLKETLKAIPTYDWESVIRVILSIPEEKE